jgi:hypothetical protein
MKKLALAAVAALTVAGLAAPSFAALSDFDKFAAITQLKDHGINASNVYDNGNGTYRVVVTTANGGTTFLTVSSDTLQPINN